MRIAFVVNNYPPRVGGLENHVAALARHLVEQGHETFVHTLSDEPGSAVESGVRVRRWPEAFQIGGLLGFPTLAAARGIATALQEERPDLISVHTRFFPLSWLGVALGRRLRIPTLHTEHGSDYVATPSPLIAWGSRFVDWTLGRWTLRSANRVLGVSEEVVAFVRRLAGVEADVFYNAIDPPTGIAASPRRHAVFVGRIVPGKGWEDFLEALGDQRAEVTGEVLGAGSDLEDLRRRGAALGRGSGLMVRGRVPLSEVYQALEGAVLVNPTRLSEGFQTTLLEALAMGARVVTYPVPGVAKLAAQGAPVVVVPRDVAALSAALRAELDAPSSPWSADPIAEWTWPRRAAEYVEVAQTVLRASTP